MRNTRGTGTARLVRDKNVYKNNTKKEQKADSEKEKINVRKLVSRTMASNGLSEFLSDGTSPMHKTCENCRGVPCECIGKALSCACAEFMM